MRSNESLLVQLVTVSSVNVLRLHALKDFFSKSKLTMSNSILHIHRVKSINMRTPQLNRLGMLTLYCVVATDAYI